jgi:hypothetical protein
MSAPASKMGKSHVHIQGPSTNLLRVGTDAPDHEACSRCDAVNIDFHMATIKTEGAMDTGVTIFDPQHTTQPVPSTCSTLAHFIIINPAYIETSYQVSSDTDPIFDSHEPSSSRRDASDPSRFTLHRPQPHPSSVSIFPQTVS